MVLSRIKCYFLPLFVFGVYLTTLVNCEAWENVNFRLNETFSGSLAVFSKGRDPRYFYSIISASPSSKPFDLNKYTGQLKVWPGGFNYEYGEDYRYFSLRIQITSQSDKTMNDSFHVSVDVVDVNDEQPIFVNQPSLMIATIPTNANIGTFVYQLNASDPDTKSSIHYSINDFHGKGRFVVDPLSGIIRIGRIGSPGGPPGTRYELDVEANDVNAETNIPQVIRSRLSVFIGETNPQFFSSKMYVQLDEKRPVNSMVYTVRAKSFQNQPLSYNLEGSSVSLSSFTLDSATGVIKVNRILNFDNITEPRFYNFTVTASELGPPHLSSSAPLVIQLADVNDHAPLFELSTYLIDDIREDIAVDQTIFLFKATDLDSGNNALVDYDLLSDDDLPASLGHVSDPHLFSIIKETGELKPLIKLDFDRTPGRAYWFKVRASDRGANESLSTDARVRIPVLNVNDEYPEFLIAENSSGFASYLTENAPVTENIVVGVVRSDDTDGDSVNYRIEGFQVEPSHHSSAGSPPFEIDAITGAVKQVRPLISGISAYVLNISAEDDGACCPGMPNKRHVNYTNFVVKVQDVNNNRPKLNCSACNGTSVKEGFYSNHTICHLHATDGDLGDNGVIQYFLRAKDHFTINHETGSVSFLNAHLDRESMDGRHWIYLTGIAEDSGKPKLSDYCSFQITIEDVNDNRPILDLPMDYNFYVGSLAPRTVVAVLSAIDKDSGPNGQVSFFVNPSSSLENYFRIESNPKQNSAVVKIADGIDETQLRNLAGVRRKLTLPLILRDHGMPEKSSTASINIQLSTSGELRPEWDEALCTFVLAINETTQPGFTIANLTAKVPGYDGSIRYQIPTRDTNPNEFSKRIPFWYETESTGSKAVRLYLYSPVNAEVEDRYVFSVRATSSQSQLSIDRLINITILDVNDEVPFFLNTDPDNNCYYGSFREHPRETGILVATAKADDLDTTAPNNVIERYELRFTDEEDAGKFVIDSKSGEIRTNSTDFNFETKQLYSIRIVAFDGAPSPLNGYTGPNVGETFLRIQILDINDNKPKFEQRSISVSIDEHSPKGTVVVKAKADDPDKWDELSYEIMSGDPHGVFYVRNDTIYVNNPVKIDADMVSEYNLTYRAFDGRFSDYINVKIKVNNIVDEAPRFEKKVYTAQPIVENDPSRRSLISVMAVGPANVTVRYSLSGSQSSFFSNANNDISISRPLDQDELTGGHKTYRFNVEAYDNEGRRSGLYDAAIVQVPVVDINDNNPIFLQDTLVGEIKEGIREVQTALRVKAIDADSGLNGEVTYKLIDQEEPIRFHLDEKTGYLRTVFGASFDQTRKPNPIRLKVVASDQGSPPFSSTETLLINVVDINNHAPKCANREQHIELFEDASSDIPVAIVAGIDNDDANTLNGQLYFTLDKESGTMFKLTSSENVAYVYPIPGEIDYEQLSLAQRTQAPRLTVTVTLSDQGDPTLKNDTCRIIAAVRNANDNPPAFSPPNAEIVIAENVQLKTNVYNEFIVKDKDSSANKFSYRINELSNLRRQFAIHPESQHTNRPVIYVTEPLNREVAPEYKLEILAMDNQSPGLTGTATLTVILTDINNHPPHLAPLESPAIVPERSDPSIVIATIKAEDPDTAASNGNAFGFELNCAAYSSVPNICDMFSLDYNHVISQASVYAKPSIMRFDKPSYSLPIIVWDNAVNGGKSRASLSYQDTLIITVAEGDNFPHRGAHKDIEVLLYTDWFGYQGLQLLPIGRPYAEDPDNWDFQYKQYTLVENSNTSVVAYFPKDGQIVLDMANVQPGTYTCAFRISDLKLKVEAVSTVSINVKILPSYFLSAVNSVRLSGISAHKVVGQIQRHPLGPVRKRRDTSGDVSPLTRLRRSLAKAIGVDYNNVVIISISDVDEIPGYESYGPRPRSSDVFFTITDRSGNIAENWSPELINTVILGKLKQVEDETGLTLSAVPGDACSPDPLRVCPNSLSCQSSIRLESSLPLLIDANATSFIGVRLKVDAECDICRDKSLAPSFGGCNCIAGRGRCLMDSHPSGCSCKAPFDGPRCEMTSRSFQWPSGGYAVFAVKPAPRSCNSGSFQIEILPNQTTVDTLVMYMGPDLIGHNTTSCPYLMLEIVSGRPHLTLDLCSSSYPGPSVIRLNDIGNALSPGQSFTLRVSWTGEIFTVTSPDCSSPCVVQQYVPGPKRLLTGTNAILLGGKSPMGHSEHVKRTVSKNFSGCLRNLWINEELYDLWLEGTGSVGGRTTPGCPDTFAACNAQQKTTTKQTAQYITPSSILDARVDEKPNQQCNNPTISQCKAPSNRSPYCMCKPGYLGEHCGNEAIPYSFGLNSFVRWEVLSLSHQLKSTFVQLQVSFRTRDRDGILLWLDSAQIPSQSSMSRRRIDEPDHVALLISQGQLAAKLQLPPMKKSESIKKSLTPFVVDNGEWHTAKLTLDLHLCSYSLNLDHGQGAMSEMWSLPEVACSSDSRDAFLLGPSGFWYAGGRPDVVGSSEFQLDNACLEDIRVNGFVLPLSKFEAPASVAKFLASNGVSGGCSSDPLPPAPKDCSSVSCPSNAQCITEWRQVSCLCPDGPVPLRDTQQLDECPPKLGIDSDTCNCAFGVCREYSNGSYCDCFDGYYGTRCLPPGSIALESPEKSRSSPDGLQIAAIVVPLVVGICLIVILVWFTCAISSKRRAQQKAAALGINGPGNVSNVSEAELLADAVLGQSMAPVDNDAAGEEDVDLSAYDLSRLKAAIIEKQRASIVASQQQHQMQPLRASNPPAVMTASVPPLPPPYGSVINDLDRMLATRLAAADSTLEQPSALTTSKTGHPSSAADDGLSIAGTEDGENGRGEQNLDLSVLAQLGGAFSSLRQSIGVD